jgi:hypothetical protein
MTYIRTVLRRWAHRASKSGRICCTALQVEINQRSSPSNTSASRAARERGPQREVANEASGRERSARS